MAAGPAFQGFPKALPRFLAQLGRHNDRDWFESHRADYEASYLEPARAFVEAIAPKLPKLDRELRAEPRVNGAIQRINRDVRFSKDKRPYKTALVLQFLPGGKVATSGAGFMIRIDATSLGFGTGLFGLTPGELGRYRTALCDGNAGPALLEAIAAATRKTPFDLTEPDLKRPPKGYEAAPGCEDLLRHKGLAVRGAEPHPAALFGKKAVDHCLKRLETLLPVQRWLNEHVPRGR